MRTIEEITAAMTALVDGAADRSLTDDEVTAYEGMEQELKGAQRTEQIRARNAAYNVVRTPAGVPSSGSRPADTIDKAFDNFLRTGRPNADLSQLAPTNAQGEGSAPEGGYLVPDSFRQKIVDRMVAFGGIANEAETITTSTGAPLPWVTVDDTANSGEIVNEGGTFSGGADLVFGTASLGAYSYMSGGASATPLRVSLELLQDAAFNVQGLVSDKLGERIARIQAVHLVRGSGSGEPQGIVDGLTPVQPAANTGWTYADLITFIHSVDPAYRPGAKWAFNDQTLATIKKMVDSHGDPLWRPGEATMGTGTEGGTLLGYPVRIDQAFVDLDVDDSTDLCGVFGNLREGFVIRRVRDVQIMVNPYARQAYRQVEFTAWARMDAAQQNTNAYKALSGKS
ncbi:phage major capsid protein [Actinoplanes sp. NPDC049668]|uniref:phage major capsid protein n=1 Tax=unclassified Actinoplanes TaxID=2626549 RepID=UPI0033BDDD60